MGKESDTRFTPQDVLDVVREFGVISLDPCTTRDNPVNASFFYTEDDDGLQQPWRSLTFWNPPYSRGQIIKFARKAEESWRLGQVESIGLVPADTSTWATQFMWHTANAVAFWSKRICFAGSSGSKFANAFFYYGERTGRFKRVFQPHGCVAVFR